MWSQICDDCHISMSQRLMVLPLCWKCGANIGMISLWRSTTYIKCFSQMLTLWWNYLQYLPYFIFSKCIHYSFLVKNISVVELLAIFTIFHFLKVFSKVLLDLSDCPMSVKTGKSSMWWSNYINYPHLSFLLKISVMQLFVVFTIFLCANIKWIFHSVENA